MSKKLQDIKFGLEKEVESITIIQNFFNCGELKKTSKFGIIDFYNSTHYIELKSRRITHDQFDSAIIGKNKIDYFKRLKQQCYIVYNYIDGIYYIKYEKELFDTFDIIEDVFERDGIKTTYINYRIPINNLKKII
jgi:hypothetical protein